MLFFRKTRNSKEKLRTYQNQQAYRVSTSNILPTSSTSANLHTRRGRPCFIKLKEAFHVICCKKEIVGNFALKRNWLFGLVSILGRLLLSQNQTSKANVSYKKCGKYCNAIPSVTSALKLLFCPCCK